ncbi:hypothetical protein T492DRAFT_1147039 [Pavlovales sp. CCMP2436]|nr:hypothetical protein T492DRAFT_1147039 [Pavlovales sp. CCMP2436]
MSYQHKDPPADRQPLGAKCGQPVPESPQAHATCREEFLLTGARDGGAELEEQCKGRGVLGPLSLFVFYSCRYQQSIYYRCFCCAEHLIARRGVGSLLGLVVAPLLGVVGGGAARVRAEPLGERTCAGLVQGPLGGEQRAQQRGGLLFHLHEF